MRIYNSCFFLFSFMMMMMMIQLKHTVKKSELKDNPNIYRSSRIYFGGVFFISYLFIFSCFEIYMYRNFN